MKAEKTSKLAAKGLLTEPQLKKFFEEAGHLLTEQQKKNYKNKLYAVQLDKQIELKNHTAKNDMNEQEVKYNRDLLEKAKQSVCKKKS